MRNFINKNFYLALFIIILITFNNSFATGTNKSFVFNGTTSSSYILDGAPINGDANQLGFKYFNSSTSSSSKKITVDTWIYLLGDNPGVLMPVIKRVVVGGTSFYMYVKDNTAFFTVGNSAPVSTAINFPSFPAFRWIRLTGTYDGQVLKLYYDGVLADTKTTSLGPIYTTGTGLFIGKHDNDKFNGLIDEARIFNTALTSSQISSCNGGGDPSSSIPSSLISYLYGRWSFTEINSYNGTPYLKDFSSKKNYLRISDITEVVKSNPLPFFVVNSTLDLPDLNPGNEVADAGNGVVTLRSAIQEANALANLQKIYFYKTGSSPFIISPSSALPTISGPVILDGTLQRGYSGSPIVETQGAFGGLTITAGGSTVKGLKINNSSGFGLTLSSLGSNNISANQISGILISSQGNSINNNTITGSIGNGISISAGAINNLIGTTAANTITGNAGYGISVLDANGNQISNNTVVNNGLGGVFISNSSGPVIGNNVTGNTGFGISVNGGTNNQILNNLVETNNGNGLILFNGTGTLSGNTITANTGFGIFVDSSTANQINNNIVGTNALGGISISNSTGSIIENTVTQNQGVGIFLNNASGNTLSGNTVSENSGLGISVIAGTGNQITNNTVGVNSLGGISISTGSATLDGNIVSGNLAFGISLETSNNNIVSENEISDNTSQGIIINGNANNVSNNSIFNNGASGVFVVSGNNNSILSNSIYDNTSLGIELAAGANDSQVYPTLNTFYTWQDESALPEIKGGTSIQGTLTGLPEQNYRIQFFANSTLNNREGRRYLGEVNATTDIIGEADFLANLKDAVLTPDEVIGATITSLDSYNNPLSTSEFSFAIERATDEGDHYLVNTTLAGIPLHWKNGNGDYEIYGSIATTIGEQPPVWIC